MSFSPQSNCRFAGPRNQTPRADDGRKPGAAPDRRAWKQVLRNGTGSTRAAGSQYSQPLMPRFTRTCRRNVSTPGAQIIARTRTPKKHSAPGCWSPRRVAPAAERCSNAVLECRVYRRFAVTSQSKLPWTRRRRSGAEHERQRARVLEITPEMIRPCKESSPSLLQSGRCRLHS
jgi:hypothetical protein